ncbi:polyprenyl synthetase family protein [Gulosibacter chungangensis]|uniref:Polyprenyl synthetase family protein n=1 Tax=Gulosibacter chungangensis TaxID=979746 RepID=A0A7J5BD48_9MICO|nr:polyprenyl synthetase family protein [Gulosibacter chungangensis]KAB1643972.1 polyprenyl synthetase family protein [Gulosibacter chungangensis]
MPESLPLVESVSARLDALFAERRPVLESLSPELGPVMDQLITFTAGGKRTRARFLAAGARMSPSAPDPELGRAVVDAATALELFHAAALVHDDILDRSDTRRGQLSTHRAFEALHQKQGWVGDADHFGLSAAILAGDLLLMWSDDLRLEAASRVRTSRGQRAIAEFSRMRTEVTAGQYLDVAAELSWQQIAPQDRADRAIAIATSKSARYSVEAPLVIGARLAGADDDLVEKIRAMGLPLGLAFQLRDDVISVFGDERVTGKPSGDDLREGKRTLIIAEVDQRADATTAAFFEQRLGAQDLHADEIIRMQQAIRDCGALDAVETQIQQWLDEALTAMAAIDLDDTTREHFRKLATEAARREQ